MSGNVKCVVLNSTYEVLTISSARKALKLVLKGKAQIMKKHPYSFKSERMVYSLPATILMNYYIATKRVFTTQAQLNNRNLFTRDNNTCQYCGRHSSELRKNEFLTRDHVVPKNAGGKDVWSNVVTSCSTCNNKKDNKLLKDIPDMNLLSDPYAPTVIDLYMKSHFKNVSLDYKDLIDMEMN